MNLREAIERSLSIEHLRGMIKACRNIKMHEKNNDHEKSLLNWLVQKRVYFGWHHDYNIKPVDKYIALEDLKKLVRDEELSFGRGYEEVIYWKDIIKLI